MTFKISANENWSIFEWLFTLLKIETKLNSNRFWESLEVVFSPRDGPWSCAGGNHRTLTVGISPRFSSRLTFCGASSSGGYNVTINTVQDCPCCVNGYLNNIREKCFGEILVTHPPKIFTMVFYIIVPLEFGHKNLMERYGEIWLGVEVYRN